MKLLLDKSGEFPEMGSNTRNQLIFTFNHSEGEGELQQLLRLGEKFFRVLLLLMAPSHVTSTFPYKPLITHDLLKKADCKQNETD